MLADVQSSYGLARPFQGVGNFETEHQRNLVRQVCAAVHTGRLIVVSGLVGSGKTPRMPRTEDAPARAGKVARPFQGVGNFETEHQRNLVREVCAAVQTGRLIVVSGLVGSGKTHLLRRIEDELARAGKVAVAKSLAVDKRRTSLPSLIEALFYDLSPGDRAQVKIPKQAERRERDLRDIMRKGKRPVVLVVDEAHDLHHKTLTGLKRLMEVVADAGVLLSVLLVGHPRLRNDLRRPQMEEIGYRTTTFDYEGIGAERRDYVAWLLGACAAEGVKVADLMNEDALDLIAERMRTPLQIEMPPTGRAPSRERVCT